MSPSRIVNEEGGQQPQKDDVQAAINYVKAAVLSHANGKTCSGRPYLKYNFWTLRWEFLYTKHIFDEKNSDVRRVTTTYGDNDGSADGVPCALPSGASGLVEAPLPAPAAAKAASAAVPRRALRTARSNPEAPAPAAKRVRFGDHADAVQKESAAAEQGGKDTGMVDGESKDEKDKAPIVEAATQECGKGKDKKGKGKGNGKDKKDNPEGSLPIPTAAIKVHDLRIMLISRAKHWF